ncbi:hypothetical protein DBZ45_19425 [Arthrobacter globiformis]|uniref:PH domain-containing protein n=1 Tax=Arthrobacter globiformis TaxID=1665 RepID=A0A328HAM5_ARTGO|nr:hypothetical protein DBZ45_19425 [Arthrobacter globiformis]
MGDEASFHQLLVSRVAMFAFFLVSLGVVISEGLVPLSTPSGAVSEELVFWSCIGLVVLWFSWRSWRLGVRVTSTQVHIKGLFRDRKIARESVVDITALGQLVWIAPAGNVRVSPLIAFTDLAGGLAGIVREHNARTLARLREQLVGPPAERPESAASGEDRSYDPPTYRRRRDRNGPAKRAGRRNLFRDGWLAVLHLLGWSVAAAVAGWLAVEPALWLAGHNADVLRSTLRLDPYTESSAIQAVIFWGVAAAALAGNTIRLAYLMFRPGRG